MLLIAILMSASLYSVLQGLGLSRDSQERVVASNVVTGILEKIETTALTVSGFESLTPTTQTLPSQTIQNTTFKLTQTTEWVDRGATGAICNSGTNSSLILRATVVATWGIGSESVTDSTLIAPPNGALSSSEGSLPVQVDQPNGTGFANATVTATLASGSPTSYLTGPDGCVFFAQLPPGSYTVTVTSTGGVDNYERTTWSSGVAPSSIPLQVTAGGEQNGLASGAIDYTQGGTVNWSYTQAFSSPALTPAKGMPTSIDNPSQKLTNNMYSYPYSGATSGGLNPVYPDTYAIFAGGCTDADPNGISTGSSPQPFYPPATYPNIASAVVVTASGTSTATVPLYPLNLQITNKSTGAAITNATSTSSPTAVAGGGGNCSQGTPTYTLNAVSAGISDTAVGLGELVISATVTSGAKTMSGTATVWVKPDGIYPVSGGLPGTTPIYKFSGSGGSVPVPVS